jgi:hypothetical protein
MLETLPDDKVALFPHYVDKWTKIGLSTHNLGNKEITDIVHTFQKEILGTEPTPVHIVTTPLEAWDKVLELFGAEKAAAGESIGDPKEIEFVYPYLDGSFSASMMSFYDFFIEENLVEVSAELLRKWTAWKNTSDLGLIYPMPNFCVVSQKPTLILRNEHGLHCESGPALEYGPTFQIWSLNGVTVPKELVMTPSGQLDPEFLTTEKNADVKMEFIRKYGVERLLERGKLLDSYEKYPEEEWYQKSQYQLWDMACLFSDVGITYAPHLKMLNQTTGIWHVEACSPEVRTLPQAIAERLQEPEGTFNIEDIA